MYSVAVFRGVVIALYTMLMLTPSVWAQDAQPPMKKEEIEQLVAPIALYPDALVAQMLMASTYPLEVVAAARWSKANPKVTGKALEDAMQKQPWDPSVKSLTAVPQALAMMNEKLDWTQKLGDAFLGQQKEVMDAIQRLRAKAHEAGNLKSGKEQTVKTEQQDGASVIVIEPANPEVIYVPTYNPTVVYGAWPYPAYPPYYYYPPGYAAGTAVFSFSVGLVVGSAMWGGCHWGSSNVYINNTRYNNFNRTNINTTNWQHDPQHRGGAQYRDAASQNQYGGGQRGGTESREAYRGRADAAGHDFASSGASAFDGAGGSEARAQSNRGTASLGSASGATRPAGASPRAGGGGRAGGGRR